MRLVVSLVTLLTLVTGCNTRYAGQTDSDWERDVDAKPVARESSVTLPAYPQEADLVEFFFGRLGAHRYYIDAKSIAIGADGIVRYTAVTKTAGGAINVVHEGIRCKSAEKRLYALGQTSKTWVEAKRSTWERIQSSHANEYQAALYADYFCPDRMIIGDTQTALRALRAGLRGSGARSRSPE